METELFDLVLGVLARCVPRGSRRPLAESFPGVIDEFAPMLPAAERYGLAGVCAELAGRLGVAPQDAREPLRLVLVQLSGQHPEFIDVVARRIGKGLLDLPGVRENLGQEVDRGPAG